MQEGDRLLNERQVCDLVGVSKSTLRRLVAAGEFPPALRIGPRASRWRLSGVLAWIDSRPLATANNWQ